MIKVVQVVKIEDWITKFLFGNKFGKGINIVSSMKLEDRIDILNGFWTPKLYLGKGLCYSFEPRLNELDSMPVISMDEMLSMELTFNVSTVKPVIEAAASIIFESSLLRPLNKGVY